MKKGMDAINQKEFRRKFEKYFLVIMWLFIVLWTIPFLNKGIDYTDTGYNIEKYKYVFDGNGITDVGLFYTSLIGGTIYRLLPAYHLLVYRVIHWLIGIGTVVVSYNIFKKFLNKNILILLLFVYSLSTRGGEAIFSYYPLSTIVLFLELLMLCSGLFEGKKVKLFAAGFLAGINIFVRLTNVMYLPVFLCIFWYGASRKEEASNSWKKFGTAFLGGLSAVVISVLIMVRFMGLQRIIKSMYSYLGGILGTVSATENFLGIQETSGHTLMAEVKMIGYQGIQSIMFFLLFCVPMVILAQLILNVGANKENKTSFWRKIAVVVLWCVAAFFVSGRVSSIVMYVLGLASVCAGIIVGVLSWHKKHELSLLCMVNVVISVFSVIGTDKGLQRFFIVRAFQIVVLLLSIKEISAYWPELKKRHNWKIETEKVYGFFHAFLSLLMVTICVVFVFVLVPNTYTDENYSKLNYSCDERIVQLKGMKTSKLRAEQLDQYYELMNSPELQDKEVALFGFFPLGLVIGPQQDYFESVDPCVDYPRFSVEMMLEAIEEKETQGVVPVIVLSKVDAMFRGKAEDEGITTPAKQAVIDYMLTLHEYEVFAQTDYYTVYMANE